MQQGIRRILALAVVFLAAFAVVFTIRNGTDGLRRLLGAGGERSGQAYRPEQFTLPEKPPLELDDVELLARLDAEYARLTDAVVPSVVSIDTAGVRTQYLLDRSGRQYIRPVPTQGQGSGVIVTQEGHVVTNYHVIRGQQQIQVTLHNQEVYTAELIGEDPLLDIAVLRINADIDFQPLKFGDSDEARRGQIVFAIGNPFGLGETITQGIISALERSLSDTQPGLIQTDAAINPGNSGGPLVSLRGEIIGINSAIYRPDDRVNSGFQGVGFSIPSNDVMDAMRAILERGRAIRGFLGVGTMNDPRARHRLNYEGPGVVVDWIYEDSPAEKAGLRPDDVIVRYDGETITSLDELKSLVQRSRVGRQVEMEVWRGGELLKLVATIEESRPELEARAAASGPGRMLQAEEVLDAVGVRVQTRTGATGPRVVVTAIRRGGLAEGRLLPGDVILDLNEQEVTNAPECYRMLAASAAAQPTTFRILRNGRPLRVTVPEVPRAGESGEDSVDPVPEPR